MKPIDICNDKVFDMLKMGDLSSMDALYDELEKRIQEGRIVRFFSFYPPDEKNPIIVFNNLEKFKNWRIKRKEYGRELLDILSLNE
jgi:hypothetical protein